MARHADLQSTPLDGPFRSGPGERVAVAPGDAARAQAADPEANAGISFATCEGLLRALTLKLRLAAGTDPAGGPHGALARHPMHPDRNAVLECVAALERLHADVAPQLARLERLEGDLLAARAALADAQRQLAGTRAGEMRALHLASHDSLTRLPNRLYLHERLERELAQAMPERLGLALLYVDLDGFKAINDTHGHTVGDEVLKIVAARMSRALRREDVVSRIGGDEFACLLSGLASRALVSHLACKLLDAVAAPCRVRSLDITVRPSIGIAMHPAYRVNADAMLNYADAAMYRAKRSRCGYAFFDLHVDG